MPYFIFLTDFGNPMFRGLRYKHVYFYDLSYSNTLRVSILFEAIRMSFVLHYV